MKPWIITVILAFVLTITTTIALYYGIGKELSAFTSATLFAIVGAALYPVIHRIHVANKKQ
jgi:hypothetical protein